MARFVVGQPPNFGRLAILPAAFNPITKAHLALADAAIEQAGADQVAFVLPESLPHKLFDGASFEQRLAMVGATAEGRCVAVSSGGLVYEIVRELAAICSAEFAVLCGRDAAERYVSWEYGEGPSIEAQLKEYRLIVAGREGGYRPPAHLSDRVASVTLPPAIATISSSAVREAISQGRPWADMTPEPAAAVIRRLKLYRD